MLRATIDSGIEAFPATLRAGTCRPKQAVRPQVAHMTRVQFAIFAYQALVIMPSTQQFVTAMTR